MLMETDVEPLVENEARHLVIKFQCNKGGFRELRILLLHLKLPTSSCRTWSTAMF